MSSVFSQKVEAVRDKIPDSVLETPWKRTLLLVVMLVGGIAAILFFAIFGLLKGIFEEGGKSSNFSTPDEDEKTQAMIEARTALDMLDAHHHHGVNEFGTVLDGDQRY